MLESFPNVLQAEGHDTICKCSPRCSKCCFVLIWIPNLDLVVARETVHEGYKFMARAFIDDLINEWRRVIIFWACSIEVVIIIANIDGALFFVNRDGVRYPRYILDWVDEADATKLVDLNFDRTLFYLGVGDIFFGEWRTHQAMCQCDVPQWRGAFLEFMYMSK